MWGTGYIYSHLLWEIQRRYQSFMSFPTVLVSWRDSHEVFLQVEVAGMTLLAYDYLLTFSSEIDFVWKKPFTPVTLLFAITRYLPFVDNSLAFVSNAASDLSVSTCTLVTRFQIWSYVIGIAIADVILILRTVAIWHGGKRIGILLGILAIGFIIPAVYYVNKFLQHFIDTATARKYYTANIHPAITSKFISNLPSCTDISPANQMFFLYVFLMIAEAVVLLLTLLRAKSYRGGTPKLFRTLYYDSVVFFTYLFVLSMINIIVLLTARQGDAKGVLVK